MNNETAAVKLDNNKQIFSDEMLAKIAEAEKHIEENPDCWITAEESLRRLRKIVE